MAAFIMKGVFSIVTFPCVTIILTNSAPSVKVLGTLNGYATLFSGVGRAAGPAMTGAAFSWGVQHGYIITGWAFLAVIAFLGAVSTFFLEEGDGLEVPTQVAGGEEELEEDQYDTEDGHIPYDTTDDEDDDFDDDNDTYEEAVLRDVDQDDDEYYINGVSSRPLSSTPARPLSHAAASHSRAGSRQWSVPTGTDSPLPVPTASRFNNMLPDGNGALSTSLDLPASPVQSRGVPTLPKLQASTPSAGNLREPEDPGSDDPDAATAASFGVAMPLNDSAPSSPVRTRRFRSLSNVSRRGREDANASALLMSPVGLSTSNTERDE